MTNLMHKKSISIHLTKKTAAQHWYPSKTP